MVVSQKASDVHLKISDTCSTCSPRQLISDILFKNPTIYKYNCYNIFLPCYMTDQKLNLSENPDNESYKGT